MSYDCACGLNHRKEKYRDYHSKITIDIVEKWKVRHTTREKVQCFASNCLEMTDKLCNLCVKHHQERCAGCG